VAVLVVFVKTADETAYAVIGFKAMTFGNF
jgi:hypothetical protein